MSFQATAWAMSQTCGGSLAKLVLLALSDHHNRETDLCCPKIRTLAEETEMSERSVHRQLAALRDRGLIAWEQQTAEDGSMRPSLYRLLMDGATPAGGGASQSGGGATQTGGVVPQGHHLVTEGQSKKNQEVNREEGTRTPPPTAGPPTAKGTRLPDGFTPTPQMIAWVRENCPGLPASEHERFCDHWRAQPGMKGRKVDWPATWRNWMRRAYDQRLARSSSFPAGRSTTDERIAQALAVAAEFDTDHQQQLAIGGVR